MRPPDQQRALLVNEQTRLHSRAAALEQDMDALTRARRGEFDDDEHDPDGASLSSQWSMLAGLLQSAREEERQAGAALERFDAGEYSVCLACHEAIPHAQLEARPLRERCVACSA